MPGQEEEGGGGLFRNWVRGRAVLLFSTTARFCDKNDEITHFRLLVRLQQLAKRSDRQESRYKLTGRVFLMIS